ncbi:nucleotidyltransferase family protein [bacterium]|nr:nucleotidyltransferase family protein [bacterium]
MKILKRLSTEAEVAGVEFLVIGGHAINAYGYPRQTGDLDILSTADSRKFWTTTLERLGYEIIQDHEVFSRFKPPSLSFWPIDLMYVDAEVFKTMKAAGKDFDFGDIYASCPSIPHLIALKLHAMKQQSEYREAKDFLDISELYKRSDLNDSELLSLCERYGRIDVYERIKRKS